MRILFALPLLLVTACSAGHDDGNDQVTVQYNEDQAEQTLDQAGEAAENFAAGVGNVAGQTGRAIQNEVGDVDVDVDVDRNGQANAQANAQ